MFWSMELLSSLFVGRPLHILAVAVVFLAGHLVLRLTALGAPGATPGSSS